MKQIKNIKLTIQYDGTDFKGWQLQKKGERTVQDEIEKTLTSIFKRPTKIIGSGRTDAGVHAVGQVANFKTASKMTPLQIKKALNSLLPNDISIIESIEVNNKFHSQFDSKTKTYQYSILNRDSHDPNTRRHCLFYKHKLNLRLMRTAAEHLIGKHDFKHFMATDPYLKRKNISKDTVRKITAISISKKKDVILIEVTANGFLYKMVRNIVGFLLKVGSKTVEPITAKEILNEKSTKFINETAKAHGLKLLSVKY